MNRLLISALTGVATLALASSAFAADLIIEHQPMAGVVDASGRWDGPFVGVFGGYGWGDYSDEAVPEPDAFAIDGWLLGVAAGANFTLTEGIVAGIVGDIAWNDTPTAPGLYNVYIDWTASLRGRLGFDGGAFLPYVTAGLAVAGVTAVDDGLGGTDSATHVGWTAGAGIEFAATENLSVDLLYRYSDYGTQTYDVNGGPYDVTLTSHQATIGLNWSF